MRKKFIIAGLSLAMLPTLAWFFSPDFGDASSHREAPLISADPLADNTDLYAFRSPDNPNMITIIANYIPLELPEGGPNYSTFGENIRYEIHIKNQTSVGPLGCATDDITYRFTFSQTNEDPTTFFNIRLGQNLKTTYTCEKSTDGGESWTTIVTDGIVPPNNIGPRSTSFAGGATYEDLVTPAITTASTGEQIFCGPRDDAFFVDLGGVFDLGQTRSIYGSDPSDPNNARDAVAGFNTHTISLQIPIEMLQKDGLSVDQANGPLDPNFVIGVWASASRRQMTTLRTDGGKPDVSGDWVQVSRLGMPLTNEAIIPIGQKDKWNAVSPYSVEEQDFVKYFANPELALYMDDSQFGDLVPALSALRVQSMSYPALGTLPGYSTPGLDFRNTKDGAFAVAAAGVDLSGTAFAVPTGPAVTGLSTALAGPGDPRRVDIFPIFYFGVPNAIPYQLVTGKSAGPLSAGKPFIHNFLPITDVDGVLYGGDMLRLNMATHPTDRSTDEFRVNARMGLIRAAVLGLLDPMYAGTDIQAIPHMDGFPNGRRLEDDVTTIELQAVGGLVLAAVGLPFDDAMAADYSDLASAKLVAELNYNAGPTRNDIALLSAFPYQASPHEGYSYVKQLTTEAPIVSGIGSRGLGVGVPKAFSLNQNYPNPFNPSTTISYEVQNPGEVTLKIFDSLGKEVATLFEGQVAAGAHTVTWNPEKSATGVYFAKMFSGEKAETIKMVFVK